MTTTRPDTDAAEELAADLRGEVLRPSDADYDDARSLWNGMIDRRPGLIARCRGPADVLACVRFARERDLPLSVKGGGHGAPGRAVVDDGLVIDLGPMRSVLVDPVARRARVQAGARLGDLDHETQAFGLATTGGVDSRTGVAGLTLGGGLGHLARKHGLALDNVLGLDVVTADGEFVRASEEENPDLFWALRGGGGNFGVVTTFDFRLHEVGPQLAVAQAYHPFDSAYEALSFYREFMSEAPDEINCLPLIMRVPPVAPFPEEQHGRLTVALVVTHAGDPDEGRRALEPVVEFGDPILAFVDAMPYTALQSAFDAGAPDGARYYAKSQFLRELPDAAIDAIIGKVERLPGPLSMVFLETMGGAIGRVDPAATAFPHRTAAYNFSIQGGWVDPADDDEVMAWCRDFHAALTPWSTGGVYVNYLSGDESERVTEAYRDHYERLVEVKDVWDPDGVFTGNQRIEPTR